MKNDTIVVEGAVTIERPRAMVFGYVADLRNDSKWRTEILRTEIAGTAVALNTVAAEHSYLSKKVPDHVYELRCINYEPGVSVVFETTDANQFYLKSSRVLTAISAGATRFTYTLEFDSKIVKLALGFGLPRWLIAYKAKSDLKKYLKNLSRAIVGL